MITIAKGESLHSLSVFAFIDSLFMAISAFLTEVLLFCLGERDIAQVSERSRTGILLRA